MEVRLESDEIRARERARRRKEPLWGVLSFAFHVILFAVIVLMTPVKSLVFEKKEKANPAADLSADRIEQISDNLSRIRVNELLEELEALQAVLHNMDMMKEQLQKDYDDFAEKNAGERKDIEEMRKELLGILDETEVEQRKALAEHAPMRAVITNLVAEEAKNINDKARSAYFSKTAQELRDGAYDRVSTAQANAQNALDRIQVQAEYAGFGKSSQAADKLRDAQIEASKMQGSAQTETADIADVLAEYPNYLVWYNDARIQKERAVGERRGIETNLKNARISLEETEERMKEDEAAVLKAIAEEKSAREDFAKLEGEVKAARKELDELRRQK